MSTVAMKIEGFLSDKKIDDIVCVDVRHKTPLMDHIIIGTGTSRRHIISVANALKSEMKSHGSKNVLVDASAESDWAAIWCSGVIVHLFNGSDPRSYYDIERVWVDRPSENNQN